MTSQRDVWVREVGTRDGLQSIETILTTEAKLHWIEQEALSGIPEIASCSLQCNFASVVS